MNFVECTKQSGYYLRDRIRKHQEELEKRRKELFDNPMWSLWNLALPFLLPSPWSSGYIAPGPAFTLVLGGLKSGIQAFTAATFLSELSGNLTSVFESLCCSSP